MTLPPTFIQLRLESGSCCHHTRLQPRAKARSHCGAQWRQWRNRSRHPVIAEIIEEDAPSAQLLGHVDDIELRILFRHSNAKAFASGQVSLLFLEAASAVMTCNPLPPVVLQKQTRPSPSSRSRIFLAASTTVENATLGPGSGPRGNERDQASSPARRRERPAKAPCQDLGTAHPRRRTCPLYRAGSALVRPP